MQLSTGPSVYLTMFDKWTKRISQKVTDSAAEGMKKSFNDRMDQYGDIIQIGLVTAVIILGGNHFVKRSRRNERRYMADESYIPAQLPCGQPPIVINNYYREREEQRYEQRYGKRNAYIENRQVFRQVQPGLPAAQTHQGGKNRR